MKAISRRMLLGQTDLKGIQRGHWGDSKGSLVIYLDVCVVWAILLLVLVLFDLGTSHASRLASSCRRLLLPRAASRGLVRFPVFAGGGLAVSAKALRSS